ncbi:MAG: hypothetical protein IJ017_02430 [Oscillospiraceae bacterium]|nr:hypothetical protein [Oscillospiraceae bacterium]
MENEIYRELSDSKINALQILKDVCRIENDDVFYHVPQKFIASLFMVTERDIDKPPYPEELLLKVRAFLDYYCTDDRDLTVDLKRPQIAEMIDTVTRYRVYNCDNEKYIMNYADRVAVKRRTGVHLDPVSKDDLLKVLKNIPEAKEQEAEL